MQNSDRIALACGVVVQLFAVGAVYFTLWVVYSAQCRGVFCGPKAWNSDEVESSKPFCEEPSHDSAFMEPFNTHSSLALWIPIFTVWLACSSEQTFEPDVLFLVFSALFAALGSVACHASHAKVSCGIDQLGFHLVAGAAYAVALSDKHNRKSATVAGAIVGVFLGVLHAGSMFEWWGYDVSAIIDVRSSLYVLACLTFALSLNRYVVNVAVKFVIFFIAGALFVVIAFNEIDLAISDINGFLVAATAWLSVSSIVYTLFAAPRKDEWGWRTTTVCGSAFFIISGALLRGNLISTGNLCDWKFPMHALYHVLSGVGLGLLLVVRLHP